VLRAGAGYLPLDPAYPAERIELIMDDARTPLVVTDRAHEAPLAGSGASSPAPSALCSASDRVAVSGCCWCAPAQR